MAFIRRKGRIQPISATLPFKKLPEVWGNVTGSLILPATSVILVNEPMALYRQDISGNPKWKIYTGLFMRFAST